MRGRGICIVLGRLLSKIAHIHTWSKASELLLLSLVLSITVLILERIAYLFIGHGFQGLKQSLVTADRMDPMLPAE